MGITKVHLLTSVATGCRDFMRSIPRQPVPPAEDRTDDRPHHQSQSRFGFGSNVQSFSLSGNW